MRRLRGPRPAPDPPGPAELVDGAAEGGGGPGRAGRPEQGPPRNLPDPPSSFWRGGGLRPPGPVTPPRAVPGPHPGAKRERPPGTHAEARARRLVPHAPGPSHRDRPHVPMSKLRHGAGLSGCGHTASERDAHSACGH